MAFLGLASLVSADSECDTDLFLFHRVQLADFSRSTVCMLWTIAVILLVLWLLGFSFHVGGGLIHLVLVIVVIVVIIKLVTGRSP